jgi:uncharacterized damage-inducible protein DinB
MRLIDPILEELDQEAHATRRVLARVPDAQLSWRPHPKSFSLGQLALHVATIPGSVAQLAALESLPEPPAFVQPAATSASELVPALDASLAHARQVLSGFDDATMRGTWRLLSGGRELMALPRATMLRTIMLNHWYHHRGQLLVYLRVHDVPLPSVYGPTADESPFVMAPAEASRSA